MTSDRTGLKSGRVFLVLAGLLTGLLVAFAANAVMLWKSQESLPNDWRYFNSLSLVVRSAILHYKTIPIHNPWVCGGLDVFANPQNRIFSPFLVADLMLSPQLANLCGLLVYGAFGFYGMQSALRLLGTSHAASFLGAFLFVNGSWFGLHFYTGHIPFGAIQMIPFGVVALLSIRRPGVVVAAAVGSSFVVLDGGIYAVFFTALLAASCLVLLPQSRLELGTSLRENPRIWFASLLTGILLTAPKSVPGLIGLFDRQPKLDFITMTGWEVTQALFNPSMTLWDDFQEGVWTVGFQEFGCYLTLTGIALIALRCMTNSELSKKIVPYLAGMLFWFWVGSGWLSEVNPWHVFHKIPIANNLHVQSRTFIIMYFFFVVALAMAWDSLQRYRVLSAGTLIALVAEALLVRNLTAAAPLIKREPVPDRNTFITSETLESTVPYADSPMHYLGTKNTGTSQCYEPAFESKWITNREDHAYRGTVWIDPAGPGQVKLTGFTPGRISLDYDAMPAGAKIVFNANALFGWQVEQGDGRIYGRGNELLVFEPASEGKGSAVLVYRPAYLLLIGTLFILGIFLTAYLGLKSVRRKGG
jgi:hypothetical protein